MKVTVDTVIFFYKDQQVNMLLVKRKYEPFKGSWAIPGGFVLEDEALDDAAKRELEEETGVKSVYMEQLYTFGDPGRDPRGHIVTVVYFAILNKEPKLEAGTDAADARWFPLHKLPKLAFDHKKIAKYALERLQNKVEYTTLAFQLLGKKFTLTQSQQVFEAVLNKKIDKRNYRKKINLLDILEPLDEYYSDGPARPARLYRLKTKNLEKIKDKGILFPF